MSFSSRPARSAVRWVRHRQTAAGRDEVSAKYLAIAGSCRVLCAARAATPAALDLLAEAGLPVPRQPALYSSDRSYEDQLRELAASGTPVVCAQWHPPGILPDRAWWIPPALLAWLHNKANLGALLPPECMPRRRVVPTGELEQRAQSWTEYPCVLKGCTDLPTGSGMVVHIVRSPSDLAHALADLGELSEIVVEEYLDFEYTVCLNYSVTASGVRYLGFGEQILDGPAFLGSWVDSFRRVSHEARAVGQAAMEAARAKGYVGLAGIDVGFLPGGRPIGFDLNFRHCGSTTPIVLDPTLRQAHPELGAIRTFSATTQGSVRSMIAVARDAMHAGTLLPLSVYAPSARRGGPRPAMTGLILGRDRDDADCKRTRLLDALAGPGR